MEEYKQNVLLKVSYDGSDFSGWQVQKKNGILLGGTVQESLEVALSKLHRCPIKTVAAGRTDAKVHAREQIVNFFTNIRGISEKQFPIAINSFLPKTIRVMEARFVIPSFSARFNALYRTYRYFIICAEHIYPYDQRYCLHLRRYPSLKALNSLCEVLYGEKDFSFFAYSRDASISKWRYIRSAHFFTEGKYLIFEITASSFLWRMVRSIVGTLLDYENKGYNVSKLKDAILKKDRSYTGPTAPPHALFLWSVEYPENVYCEKG